MPVAEVLVVALNPVSTFVIVIAALATTAFEGSVTVPATSPVTMLWARSKLEHRQIAENRVNRRNGFFLMNSLQEFFVFLGEKTGWAFFELYVSNVPAPRARLDNSSEMEIQDSLTLNVQLRCQHNQ